MNLENYWGYDMDRFTDHSGGARGSDTAWDYIGKQFGVINFRHYWHPGLPKPPLGNIQITDDELEEGWERVLFANKTLNRMPGKYKSLLGRNWFQVKNSDAIFAIGNVERNQVAGGTGWAVQMAIDAAKPVYVFDQKTRQWLSWNRTMFIDCLAPSLTFDYAGIGTREIDVNGAEAIRNTYKRTFNYNNL